MLVLVVLVVEIRQPVLVFRQYGEEDQEAMVSRTKEWEEEEETLILEEEEGQEGLVETQQQLLLLMVVREGCPELL
jgi:hypothetical protein